MPKKSVRHTVRAVVEETKEEKPQVMLKAEVVEEKPVEAVTAVSQLAAVVEPVAAVIEPPAVVEEKKIEEKPAISEPEIVEEKSIKKKRNWLWPVWILLAFGLGAVAGYFASNINFPAKKSAEKPIVNTQESSKVAEPTKLPEATFDRTKIKVKVLNGSGVGGRAAAGKEYLEGLGYKGVATGNADMDDYAVSEISVKDSLKTFTEKIRADVAGKYELSTATAVLASDDAFDVLLIIGQK